MFVPYTKPPLTYQQQLDQLKARGLRVSDEDKALFLLENISYYRLSGYWYPLLQDKDKHTFIPGATFEQAFQMYCFDKELRKLVMTELEKIEVAVRSKLVYVMSHKHGACWYTDNRLFKDWNQRDIDKFAKISQKLSDEFERSDEQFIASFRMKYHQPAPSWILLEVVSLGTLSQLYASLKPSRAKREIADYFGLPDAVLKSWLHSLLYTRNICAHHARLWTREMQIAPELPQSPRLPWLSAPQPASQKSVYMTLCMIRYLLQVVNPSTSLPDKLRKLLAQFPTINPAAMGFPPDWTQELLWQTPPAPAPAMAVQIADLFRHKKL